MFLSAIIGKIKMNPKNQEILENHAFMANVIKVGLGGVEFHQWLNYLINSIGGFIGDVKFTTFGEQYRVVSALMDPPSDAPNTGGDIPQRVISRVNNRFSKMDDNIESYGLSSVVKTMRDSWLKGGMLECSISGDGVDFDFVRGRHMLKNTKMIEALHVHGLTLICGASNPDMIIETISDQGVCMYTDGTTANFREIAEVEFGGLMKAQNSVNIQGVGDGVYGQLSNMVVRNVLRKFKGPEPQGMLISEGEDGEVMVVASLGGGERNMELSLKVLSGSIQILEGGGVIAQTQYGNDNQAKSIIKKGVISLVDFSGADCSIYRCNVV